MKANRLSLAIESGLLTLPDTGDIAVFRPRSGDDLSALPKDRLHLVQGFFPDHEAWRARGYSVAAEQAGPCAMAVILMPRSKREAQALVAQAAAHCTGPIVVDGQKTDGIDSFFKACRKRADVSDALSKSHGKLFVIAPGGDFTDWVGAAAAGPDGFITAPGVFSETKIDRASQLLVDALPDDLGRRVADLGAGWGYLSAHILKREKVEVLHLIEAEHSALECARQNITDPRARFYWGDATRIALDSPVDTIVTNPPFHTTRAAEPDLGRAFLSNAAKMLTPKGALYLVANRHLPYETTLEEHFRQHDEIGGDGGFKLLRARGPHANARAHR